MTIRAAPRLTVEAREDVHTPVVPRLVAGLVERPRLFALLDRWGCGVRPAGSGKTMLLSSWLCGGELAGAVDAVGWVDVEGGESDATRLWGMVMDRCAARARSHPRTRSPRWHWRHLEGPMNSCSACSSASDGCRNPSC